jgi:hypothetical protein
MVPRRYQVVLVVAALASLSVAGSASGAVPPPAEPVVVADPTGDVAIDRWPEPNDPVEEPRADMTAASIKVGPSELQLSQGRSNGVMPILRSRCSGA